VASTALPASAHEVTGHRIVEMKGQVFGLVVRSRGSFSSAGATVQPSHPVARGKKPTSVSSIRRRVS
jgi:hypothetical protein